MIIYYFILPINPQKSLLLVRIFYSVWFWDLCEITLPSYAAGETEWCYIRSDKVHIHTQYVCYKIRSNATREWFIRTLNQMEEVLDLLDRNWISWSALTNTSSLLFFQGGKDLSFIRTCMAERSNNIIQNLTVPRHLRVFCSSISQNHCSSYEWKSHKLVSFP